jgi:hypothetical protein
MSDKALDKAKGGAGRTSGWYVLLLTWAVYAVAYLVVFKLYVKAPTDVTNSQIISYGTRFGALVGIALGLVTFLVTGLVYLIVRLIVKRQRRLAALVVSALGYATWWLFGYDLVYREPRYAEIARAIITYTGKPMLYAAEITVGLCLLGAVGCVVRMLITGRKK